MCNAVELPIGAVLIRNDTVSVFGCVPSVEISGWIQPRCQGTLVDSTSQFPSGECDGDRSATRLSPLLRFELVRILATVAVVGMPP